MREIGVDQLLARASRIAIPLYREFPPARDLLPFIACTWVRLVKCEASELNDAILPDGCADIMVYDSQPPRVAGPDAVTRHTSLRDGLVIAGIRLRPGACRAVLGCPATDIVNGGAQLSDIVPGARELHRRLMASGNLRIRLALLEDWVRNALDNATDHDRAVVAACRLLGAGSTLDVAEVARRLDWNTRMIHRQFMMACGYSPKHFQRIMRIQETLRIAGSREPGRLADLAIAAGYADQSHMTRDLRGITGFTPAAYLSERAPAGWGAWIDGW